MKKSLVALSVLVLACQSGYAQNQTKADPIGFGSLKQAMDELKSSGKISAQTKAQLEEVQKRGAEARAMLKREDVGRKELQDAEALMFQDKFAEADPLFRKALKLREAAYGPNDWLVANPLSGLAKTYRKRGWPKEAIVLYQRAAAIEERVVLQCKRSNYLEQVQAQQYENSWAHDLGSIARAYEESGQYANAEAAYKRALAVADKYAGAAVYKSLDSWSYAQLLRKLNREGEALSVEAAAERKKRTF